MQILVRNILVVLCVLISGVLYANGSSVKVYQGFSGGMDYINTNNQLLILGSYDLINRTVQDLPFGVDFYTRGHFRTNSLYGREPISIELKYADPQLYECEFRFIPIDNNNFEIVLEDEFSKLFKKI